MHFFLSCTHKLDLRPARRIVDRNHARCVSSVIHERDGVISCVDIVFLTKRGLVVPGLKAEFCPEALSVPILDLTEWVVCLI